MKVKASFKFEPQTGANNTQESALVGKLREYKAMIAELSAIYAINKRALSLNIKELKEGYEQKLIEVLNQENQLLYSALVGTLLKEDELREQAAMHGVPTLARENVEIYKINTLVKKYIDLKTKNEKILKKLKPQTGGDNHRDYQDANRCSNLDFLKSKLGLNKANMLFLKHKNQMKKEIDELRYRLEDTKTVKNDIVRINFVR